MNSTISAPCVYNVNSERLGGTSRHNIWQHIEGGGRGRGGEGHEEHQQSQTRESKQNKLS